MTLKELKFTAWVVSREKAGGSWDAYAPVLVEGMMRWGVILLTEQGVVACYCSSWGSLHYLDGSGAFQSMGDSFLSHSSEVAHEGGGPGSCTACGPHSMQLRAYNP